MKEFKERMHDPAWLPRGSKSRVLLLINYLMFFPLVCGGSVFAVHMVLVLHYLVLSSFAIILTRERAGSLLSNVTVGALIRNVGPSESMIRLSFNMAAASHTWFRNEEF